MRCPLPTLVPGQRATQLDGQLDDLGRDRDRVPDRDRPASWGQRALRGQFVTAILVPARRSATDLPTWSW
jgi:hypothetical protein